MDPHVEFPTLDIKSEQLEQPTYCYDFPESSEPPAQFIKIEPIIEPIVDDSIQALFTSAVIAKIEKTLFGQNCQVKIEISDGQHADLGIFQTDISLNDSDTKDEKLFNENCENIAEIKFEETNEATMKGSVSISPDLGLNDEKENNVNTFTECIDPHSYVPCPTTRSLSCSKCSYVTNYVFHLQAHKKKMHFTDFNFCSLCNSNKAFASQASLKEHVRNHTCFMRLCRTCNLYFSSRLAYTKHWRTKHRKPDTMISCKYCQYKCDKKLSLLSHMHRLHRDLLKDPDELLQHVCLTCNRRFSGLNSLKNHQRSHTGERPYACNHCDYKAIRPKEIRAHVKRLHSQAFSCNDCPRRFTDEKSLQTHVKIDFCVHKCSLCIFKSPRKDAFESHLRKMHRDKLSLEVLKPFPCDMCTKRFTRKYHATNHIRRKICQIYKPSDNSDNIDDKCLKFPKAKNNKKSQKEPKSKVDPFVCEACHERFDRLKVLNRHKEFCVHI